jgi:hypothetical protein
MVSVWITIVSFIDLVNWNDDEEIYFSLLKAIKIGMTYSESLLRVTVIRPFIILITIETVTDRAVLILS